MESPPLTAETLVDLGISRDRLPRHIAVIMDAATAAGLGSGAWPPDPRPPVGRQGGEYHYHRVRATGHRLPDLVFLQHRELAASPRKRSTPSCKSASTTWSASGRP